MVTTVCTSQPLIISAISINKKTVSALRLFKHHAVHGFVYRLFSDVKFEKCINNRILFVDKTNRQGKKIIILSDLTPKKIEGIDIVCKTLPQSFLEYDRYAFEVTVNPVKRFSEYKDARIILKDNKEIFKWFVEKATSSWGFTVSSELQIHINKVKTIYGSGHTIFLHNATIKGTLVVIDRVKFINSITRGIGQGKAFGCGLLQVLPIIDNLNKRNKRKNYDN